MATQTFQLGTLSADEDWSGAILIDPAFVEGGGDAYLRGIAVFGGSPRIAISATATGDSELAGPELTLLGRPMYPPWCSAKTVAVQSRSRVRIIQTAHLQMPQSPILDPG